MTTKDEVIEVNRLHPDWPARAIADHLGCMTEYVNKVKHRYGVPIPTRKFVPPKLKRTERRAALMDLKFLHKAIRDREDTIGLLRRVEELSGHLRAGK